MTAQEKNTSPIAHQTVPVNLDNNRERASLLQRLEDLQYSQQQIERAHHEWLGALDTIRDLVFMHDKECRIMRSNRAYAERAGLSVKDVLGKPYWEVFPKLDGPMLHCGTSEEAQEEIRTASEEIFQSRSFSVKDDDGSYLYSLHVMEDITERKRMQMALKENEEKFHQICATAQDAILMMDSGGLITYWNDAAERLFGYETGEALGKRLHDLIVPERFRGAFYGNLPEFARTGTGAAIGKTLELAACGRGGLEFPIELSVSAARLGGQWCAVGFVRDITKRKRNEEAILRVNRAFKTLSAGNHELVRAGNELQLLQSMCRVLVEIGGYRMAWVGYLEHDPEKSVRPMAQKGCEEGYLEVTRITWDDAERGCGPAGRAAREGKVAIAQDIQTDPSFLPWRAEACKRGYASCIALPLINEGGVFGVLAVYAAETNAFDPDETELLEELASDLAFGIQAQRMQQEQMRIMERLRVGLEGTVQAIAAMVEMRDPYTAGHQQRVAELAAAIAVEMGLDEERVRGIHLAGTIHDLGKIQTPAEILTMPRRLSVVEFNLIKEHPQKGYEILKDIQFPWPIAQMVLQHHEKLDGSGYPQGLKGNEIILEARMLTVADVVEAMASHRPYRPGLGLDVALEEISKGRGVHYDPDVVDACIRLFKEKNYALKEVLGKR